MFDAFYPLVNNFGICKFYSSSSSSLKCNRWQQFLGKIHAPFFEQYKTVDTTLFFFFSPLLNGLNVLQAVFFFISAALRLIICWLLSQTNRRWWHRFVLSLSLALFSPLYYDRVQCSSSFSLWFKPFAHQRCSMLFNDNEHWI